MSGYNGGSLWLNTPTPSQTATYIVSGSARSFVNITSGCFAQIGYTDAFYTYHCNVIFNNSMITFSTIELSAGATFICLPSDVTWTGAPSSTWRFYASSNSTIGVYGSNWNYFPGQGYASNDGPNNPPGTSGGDSPSSHCGMLLSSTYG